jgi:ubiquinone/menaquinone biosynthesis C-methylase UbiE
MSDFDARAATWDEDPAKVSRAEKVAAAIRGALPIGAETSALDYGCGTGLLGLALRPHVGRLTLADSSEGMLAVLRGKIAAGGFANAAPLRLDLATDPVPAERFDLVCTLMTLHHVRDIEGLLGRFLTLLRPGGALCVADLDREDGSFHGPGVDVHPGFDRAALGRSLVEVGFEMVSFSTADEVVRDGGSPARRVYPVFLAVARKARS